jgi:hypothetical protein
MLKANVSSVEQRYVEQRDRLKNFLYEYNYKKQHIFKKGWHYAIAILHLTYIDIVFQLIDVPIAVNKNWFTFQIFNTVIL